MGMPAIQLDKHEQMPLHRQLYLELKRLIVTGHLQSGRRLPSTRELAEQLLLSRATVSLAYDQLLEDNLVEAFRGSGTFVRREVVEAAVAFKNSRVGTAHPERFALGRTDTLLRSLSHCGRNLYSLAVGTGRAAESDLDEPLIDFTPWPSRASQQIPVKSWRRQLAKNEGVLSNSSDPLGHPLLREAIADRLVTSRNLDCTADQIVVTGGSRDAFDLIARVHIDRGDMIAMEDPAFPAARQIFAAHGAKVRAIPVDKDGMVVDALKSYGQGTLKLAYSTPAKQFPLGMSLSLQRRVQLLEWSHSTGTVLLEDDYGSEYTYCGFPAIALKALDQKAPVIFMGTFSKLLFPSVKLGFLVVPAPLVPLYAEAKRLFGGQFLLLEQQTLAQFIHKGLLDRHIRKEQHLYAERRNLLLQSLKQRFGQKVKVSGAESGTHLVIQLETGFDDDVVVERARRAGVNIISTSAFYQPVEMDGRTSTVRRGEFMICFARVPERDIIEGIQRLSNALMSVTAGELCDDGIAFAERHEQPGYALKSPGDEFIGLPPQTIFGQLPGQ